VVRSFAFVILSAALLARASDQRDSLDPAFEKIPFDQWLSEHGQAPFRWTLATPRAELSFHQRLITRVEAKIDGRGLESRRGDGELVFFVQITDRDGTRFQNHSAVELSKLDPNIKAADLQCIQTAFLLPGDYRLAAGLLDTRTGEHSVTQSQFRVASPHNFLPDAWHSLPPVEFIGKEASPDDWYLPGIRGRLQWAASAHSPARINVILNVAPSVTEPGTHQSQSGDLAALLPTLKVISQTGSPSLWEHVELLDLARRRAAFEQDQVHDLDWPRLKASLTEANTASIDVHSLTERHHDAQFFVSQVRSLLRASEKLPCVLVVLTNPVAFESGEDLEQVSTEALPACNVFYIRYHEPIQRVSPFDPQMRYGRGSRRGGGPIRNRPPQEVVDQLEATLKPLSPKVFDVQTPDQITKVLGEIEKSLLALDGQSSR
jgi:hypothetical protein